MRECVAVEVRDPLEWDALVASMPFTSALQGWGWGEAKRLTGWEPYRLRVDRAGEAVAAAQVLRRRLVPGATVLYAPRGPAMRSLTDIADVGRALRRWAGRSDLRLKLEPPVPLAEDAEIPAALGPFRRAETEQPEHTILVDLTAPEDVMLKRMHQMARRNTKTSLKLGVTAGPDDDFDAFWALFSETNERSKLLSRTRAYYEAVYHECGRYGGEARLITARLDGQALASGLVIGLGPNLNYLYGGSTRAREEGERDPKGSNGFYWGMLLYGAQAGYRELDLFGIPRKLDPEKHAFGVYQFKERLGGQRVHFPAYELGLSPLARAVTAALRARKTLMNYRARGSTRDVL
ncbi:MAG TPA: peptidoglycan bridge formation glycyltransferase FemA/FemB family protein [Deinococcales bacterium]|nr:peptidoglycan bridge formation glycyltransferase FemA/FemB family protein [Deinococcales bacterium]